MSLETDSSAYAAAMRRKKIIPLRCRACSLCGSVSAGQSDQNQVAKLTPNKEESNVLPVCIQAAAAVV